MVECDHKGLSPQWILCGENHKGKINMADEHKNTKKQDTAAATAAAREAAARAAGHVNPAVEALLEQTAKKSDRNNGRDKHTRSDQTAKTEAADKADLPTASDAKPADKTEEQTAAEQTTPKAENDLIDAIVDKIDATDDILVTLSRDPSIDEMAAAIGLTLFLDRLDKHATAIYSGHTPKILEFLHPDKTFEKNTDSLRDFIVALSKDKADHLRYKLDGDFVKIYITPYKTTITPEDLDFSYGNYNVDLVLALDVPEEGKLDNALKEFGKITEGAEIIDITTGAPGKVGQLEWSNPNASSISELAAKLVIALEDDEITMNAEEATAFLTGIVAETERFSNAKTTADVMSLAADLMDRGADQQLIPRDLRPEPEPRPDADTKEETPNRDAAEASDQGETETTPPVEPPVAPEPENKSVEAEGKLAINSRRRRNVATIVTTPAAPEAVAPETEPETPEPTMTSAPEAIAAEVVSAPAAEPAAAPIDMPEPAAVPEPAFVGPLGVALARQPEPAVLVAVLVLAVGVIVLLGIVIGLRLVAVVLLGLGRRPLLFGPVDFEIPPDDAADHHRSQHHRQQPQGTALGLRFGLFRRFRLRFGLRFHPRALGHVGGADGASRVHSPRRALLRAGAGGQLPAGFLKGGQQVGLIHHA